MVTSTVLLFLLGAAVGGQLNRAIYRWAWNQRWISPWTLPPEGVDRRTWADCVPIVGWWRLRREVDNHGKLFWLRPMLIEAISGLGLAALFVWIVQGQQLPPQLQPPAEAMIGRLQATFLANAILFALMLVATFIDIDEKTIPDYVTVPGTLVALLLAAVMPYSFLPIMPPPAPPPAPILLSSPGNWPAALDSTWGLTLGLFAWSGWCYGLLPKTLYLRRGWMKALQFLVASIRRHPLSKWMALLWIVGVSLVTAAWSLRTAEVASVPSWQGLLSSLTGLAFGGGMVWAVRAVAGYVMRVEAMGFGDVTLMAMIGAFLGWQGAILTFFLAPFTSLAIAVTQYIVTGRRDIPFGPFLCAAAAIVVIFWGSIWSGWGRYFNLGLYIPLTVLIAVVLMGVMLSFIQFIKRLVGISDY